LKKKQKQSRAIFHIQFTKWPDFDEPDTPHSILELLDVCKRQDVFNNQLYGPCVVHCSGGVGRSGTFILVDSISKTQIFFNIPFFKFLIFTLNFCEVIKFSKF
jgi:protein tyrosine phosphatase